MKLSDRLQKPQRSNNGSELFLKPKIFVEQSYMKNLFFDGQETEEPFSKCNNEKQVIQEAM